MSMMQSSVLTCHGSVWLGLLPVEYERYVASIGFAGRLSYCPYESNALQQTKNRERKPMTLEEMELALARIDVMIRFLKKRMSDGTNCRVAEDITRYQQWRDDLDVRIGLERIKRSTDRRHLRRVNS
jgi:hypothetical protein